MKIPYCSIPYCIVSWISYLVNILLSIFYIWYNFCQKELILWKLRVGTTGLYKPFWHDLWKPLQKPHVQLGLSCCIHIPRWSPFLSSSLILDLFYRRYFISIWLFHSLLLIQSAGKISMKQTGHFIWQNYSCFLSHLMTLH